MTRKREPVAELAAEDYRIVRHTHNIDLAADLMRAALFAEDGCPDRIQITCDKHASDDDCLAAIDPGKPVQRYVRIQGALPNSYAAAEGWKYQFIEHDEPGRGRFPAVIFR